MKTFTRISCTVLGLFCLSLSLAAQDFQVSKSTFAASSAFTQGTNFQMKVTLGQVQSGIMSGAEYELLSGFWYSRSQLVSIDNPNGNLPIRFQLDQNFPNPFNPSTNIRFALPEAVMVQLEVYNMLGQRVAVIYENTALAAGWHEVSWNGRDQFGYTVASGIYLYRIAAGKFVESRKMILLK